MGAAAIDPAPQRRRPPAPPGFGPALGFLPPPGFGPALGFLTPPGFGPALGFLPTPGFGLPPGFPPPPLFTLTVLFTLIVVLERRPWWCLQRRWRRMIRMGAVTTKAVRSGRGFAYTTTVEVFGAPHPPRTYIHLVL